MESFSSTISLLLSALSIFVSLRTYFIHDRKLKKQEQLLNTYQLNQFENEEQSNKKADIVGEISLLKGEQYLLRIQNKGKASAKNIRIEEFDTENYCIHNNTIIPYHCLNADEAFTLKFFRIGRSIPTMTIIYIWDDDWNINRKKQQTIQLR